MLVVPAGVTTDSNWRTHLRLTFKLCSTKYLALKTEVSAWRREVGLTAVCLNFISVAWLESLPKSSMRS